MNIKLLSLAAIAAAAAMAGAGAASATTFVDLAGTDSVGQTFTNVAPGTYEISEIAGKYSAADLWYNSDINGPAVSCGATAGACTYGYVSNLDITINGVTTEYTTPPPAGAPRAYGVYDTPAAALSAFQSEVGPISVTLTSPSTVNFKLDDNRYVDNAGGLSLAINQVSAAPEPGTWALMIAGLGVAGLALRRRTLAAPLAA